MTVLAALAVAAWSLIAMSTVSESPPWLVPVSLAVTALSVAVAAATGMQEELRRRRISLIYTQAIGVALLAAEEKPQQLVPLTLEEAQRFPELLYDALHAVSDQDSRRPDQVREFLIRGSDDTTYLYLPALDAAVGFLEETKPSRDVRNLLKITGGRLSRYRRSEQTQKTAIHLIELAAARLRREGEFERSEYLSSVGNELA